MKENTIKRGISVSMLLLAMSICFSGCLDNDMSPNELLVEYSFFEEGDEGWIGEFAGFPAYMEDSMKLEFKHESFHVSESVGSVSALKQSGYAVNSNLFMYVKQQVSGLRPSARYLVKIQAELNSQLLEAYSGTLDDEYQGSFLKVGAFNTEPVTMETPDSYNAELSIVAADFDKGDSNRGGIDMVLIGRLEYTDVGAAPIMLNGSNADYPIYAATDQEGKLWIAVGVDTNIPVYQEIAYTYIVATFEYQNDI